MVEGVARILWQAQGHADIVDLLAKTQDKATLDIQATGGWTTGWSGGPSISTASGAPFDPTLPRWSPLGSHREGNLSLRTALHFGAYGVMDPVGGI